MNQDQNPNETLAKLTELLRQATANLNPAAPAPQFGWPSAAPPTFAPSVQPTGILVPIRLDTPAGEVGCYVNLPASALQSLPQTIAAMQAQGWPIRIYNGGSSNAGQWPRRRSWGRRW